MTLPTHGRTTAQDIAASLDLTPEVIARRLEVLGLQPSARAKLRALAPKVLENAPNFLDALYARLGACPATRAWVGDPAFVERLKRQQHDYVARLFGADLDFEHALYCIHIGFVHHRVRLTPQWFVATYGHVVCDHLPLLVAAASSTEEALELVGILLKSALFDAALALDGYAMSAENAARAAQATGHAPEATVRAAPALAAPAAPAPAVTRNRVALDDATERAAFLEIDDETSARLHALAPAVQAALPQILDEFYALFSQWEETRDLVPQASVERLKRQVGSYWVELTRSQFDRPYAASRTLVGIIHERIGLSSPLYVIGLAQQVTSLLGHAVARAPEPMKTAEALLRAVFFDLSFVLQAYMDARAAAALRTEGFAAELLSGLSAGVVIVDARLRVEVVNEALLGLFGLDARLVRFVQLGQLIPLPAAVELVRRAWSGRDDEKFSEVIARDGRIFRATVLRLTATGETGKPTVALVLDEITEILRAQKDAIETERSYAEVLDAVQTFAWEADDDACTLSMVSRSALAVTGFRDVALLGRAGAFTDLMPEPDRARFVALCRGLALGQRGELHHRLRRADGSVVWLRTALARLSASDGRGVICGTSVDVTATQLADQRRLDAIGKLAGGIAHEYNNQLLVVLSCLALVEDGAPDESPRELLVEARKAAERCAAITRTILGFAQQQVLRPRPTVLNDVLGAARPTLARLLGAGVEIEFRLAPELWPCNVDASELEIALTNLVANANESMPAGGRVTLSTRNHPATEPVEGDEPVGQDMVEIAVADVGTGMDAGVKARAFDPFFTTKPSGTGLGLSLVHGFVAQSGGRVALATDGGGTVVRLLFPRIAPADATTAAPDGAPLVLAVDDEPAVLRILARLLSRLGYAVVTARSSDEALAAIRERVPDVLVTDVVLAQGDSGARLAPRARKLAPGLPVVYVSGYTRQELDLEHLDEQEWFLEKPFSKDALAKVLTEALALHAEKRGA